MTAPSILVPAALAAALGVACDRGNEPPLERVPVPSDLAAFDAARVVSTRPPPPPPPPPPPAPGPRPPPTEIAAVLRGAETPAVISLHELDARSGGARFLGYRRRATRVLAAAHAHELAARFMRPTSYYDGGDVGCVGDPVGIRVVAGARQVDLVEDCSHLYLTEEGHDGPWVLLSSEMADHIRELREVTLEHEVDGSRRRGRARARL